MLQRQADLGKPVQNVILTEKGSLRLADDLRHVPTLSIVHHDIEVAALGLEAPNHLDDAGMVQCLQYACFLHSVLLLLIAPIVHVDLLQDTLLAGELVVHQIALAEGAFTQHLDLFEVTHVHI